MAVFTSVRFGDLQPWLRRRGVVARDIAEIGEGIENSNYRVFGGGDHGAGDLDHTPDRGGCGFVFTIFELWDMAQVRYYAGLMNHLAGCGLPVPAPVFAPELWTDGKPCLLVPFVESDGWRDKPSVDECRTMGVMVARLHLAAAGFGMVMENPRGASWRRDCLEKLRGVLPPMQLGVIVEELNRDGLFAAAPLPFGACHCDLFRNNVLWQGSDIAAVIDFYFGGGDALIFDLAVAGCDWCFDGDGFNRVKLDALFDGYFSLRALCPLEKELLSDAFCIAALRFWLSRLYDLHFPRAARMLQAHDPKYFEDILMAARGMRKELAKTSTIKTTMQK